MKAFLQFHQFVSNHLKKLLLIVALGIMPASAYAQFSIGISINIAPPELPVYVQPPCPVDGYLWSPGHWAWGPFGYFWVPGVWVAPPQVGLLWTPGYWGYDGSIYGWHGGYWGAHIGFYGGVNYGFGYGGVGFVGGNWAGGVFRYNTAVVNVDTTVVHNVYVDRTVVNNVTVTHTSFNGPGGLTTKPTAEETAAMHEQHFPRTAEQTSHEKTASSDPSLRASVNHGSPKVAALDRVGGHAFTAKGEATHMKSVTERPAGEETRGTGEGEKGTTTTEHPMMKHRATEPGETTERPMMKHRATEPGETTGHPMMEHHAVKERPAMERPMRMAPEHHSAPAVHKEKPHE